MSSACCRAMDISRCAEATSRSASRRSIRVSAWVSDAATSRRKVR
ncbi:hypothetical protein [Nocardioides zeae]